MKTLFFALALLLSASNFAQAEVFQKVRYMGGFPDLNKKEVKGELEITEHEVVFWKGKKKKQKALFRIPNASVVNVSVNQKEFKRYTTYPVNDYGYIHNRDNKGNRRSTRIDTSRQELVVKKSYYDYVYFEFRDHQNGSAGVPFFRLNRDLGQSVKTVAEMKSQRDFDRPLAYTDAPHRN